jgi:DNA replication and repair protein RecF
MRVQRLQLFDYRNFHRLDIEIPSEVVLFIGANAQGKTNLLEAVYLLATLRGLRVETDAQLIRREVMSDPLPAARIVGDAETSEGSLKLEVAVVARTGARGPIATKTVKVNGAPKRLADAVGRLTAVLFSADDLLMIEGTPSLRRRYVDLMVMQFDRAYAAARSRYDRVITQRNHLLKRIRDGEANAEELTFWDDELSKDGGLLMQCRASVLAEIGVLAAEHHRALAPDEALDVLYEPRLEPRPDGQSSSEEFAAAFGEALARGLSRDLAAGMTLQGPHRDDVSLKLNGAAAAGYASRAQQRTIALSLRLAEAEVLRRHRGEPPVLLLDDVLSEMDATRRTAVLSSLGDVQQLLITGTDWDRFPPAFLANAARFAVEDGCARPLDSTPAAGETAGS